MSLRPFYVGAMLLTLCACASKSASGPYSMVHFKYDQSVLDSQARAQAKDTAKAMKKDGNSSVLIEGHCDERGSNEYNIALGEKRAKAVYDYIVDLGISPKRLQTKSWGEERPIDTRANEKAYAKNRRAEFVKSGPQMASSKDDRDN